MRLIDADTLVSMVSGHVISMSVCLSKEERYGMERMFHTIMNDIQNAPTMAVCSLPKNQIGRLPVYKYCPRCGARMEGDD